MRKVRKPLAKALRKAIGAREPDMGLTAVLAAVQGAAMAEREAMAKARRKSQPAGVATRKRNKRKRIREGIAAKARERSRNGTGFRGTAQKRAGLLPLWAETLADAPDEPFSLVGHTASRAILMHGGWVRHESGVVLRYDLPPINKRSGYRARTGQTYMLTEEGKVVRAWLQWVRARRVMGWPCPTFGNRGAYVRYWVFGEDVPAAKAGRGFSTAGYLPGDAADEAWPGLWDACWSHESGSSGMVASETPD